MLKKIFKKRIYMDYGAGAPEVRASIVARSKADKAFANPSSIHTDGLKAKSFIDKARSICASSLSAHTDEIIFTSNGTESDNLAIFGVFKHIKLNNPEKKIHIVTTKIEHPAILEACKHLEEVGAEVTYLPLGSDGIIDIKDFRNALKTDTVLVSIGYANSEIGVIQPIKEIAKEIRHFKKNNQKTNLDEQKYPLFHTDACQAGTYLKMNVDRLGIDLLSLNGTKIGGPRGTGLLYVRRGVSINSIVYGGGQEKNLRSGTENVSGAYGLACAFLQAQKDTEKESKRLSLLRDYCIDKLESSVSGVRINGSKKNRLPNNVNFSLKNFDSELLVIEMDRRGVSVSAGSACGSAESKVSHVIESLYEKNEEKWGTVRLSFGRDTSKYDIDRAIYYICDIVKKYEKYQK